MNTRSLSILCLVFVLLFNQVQAQHNAYSTKQAHSHNDYEQAQPFFLAYQEQFGSIEADIHLVNGKILVGHDNKSLTETRSLEELYLKPLATAIQKNAGQVYYNQQGLQLLIDVKTAAEPTLVALVDLLKQYPSLTNCKNLKLVISGNRPSEEKWKNYPAYIWFDGRLSQTYSEDALNKTALLSDDFGTYVKAKFPLQFTEAEQAKIQAVLAKAKAAGKPTRFWGAADDTATWKKMMDWGLDYINTDHIIGLSDFLVKSNKAQQLLPYNRIIQSAGDVVRFGKTELENHALDAAALNDAGLFVVEDRYGLLAMDAQTNSIVERWSYTDNALFKKHMSVYSGIRSFQHQGKTMIAWGAADNSSGIGSLMLAEWNNGFKNISSINFNKQAPASNPLPNGIAIVPENQELFLYVVLNGNNRLVKIRFSDKQILWESATGVAPYGVAFANQALYVSNWAGENATDSLRERAGVPWGFAYTDPRTGATQNGTVSVIEAVSGKLIKEIRVGLHPNAILASADEKLVYVANGSSDEVSVIQTKNQQLVETIPVGLMRGSKQLLGSTPNALTIDETRHQLYVANGLDNAIAVVQLGKLSASNGKGKTQIMGYIPTEAFPGGLLLTKDKLIVTNLESNGANVVDQNKKARSIHQQLASVSLIPLPDKLLLEKYTQEVAQLNLLNRVQQQELAPRPNRTPIPVPERTGEPSVFKHVIYIIKENKTYDQVFGDMPKGNNDSSLTIFGKRITPNIHAMANQYGWMDQYYASGKSSAEGHQWTDAGIVSDYVEKNVRAWFRSYPHRQEDAMVYNPSGFIWNHALDHGKTVRVFGEACKTVYDRKKKWSNLYADYQNGVKPDWYNVSTIARLKPIISPQFPDCDNIAFTDQLRADIFIKEWDQYAAGDSLPNLMVLSLPNDHSSGTSPDFPTPNAMVADNDLALGRIMEHMSKSKYWDSTVVFITQDDSQGGWDHISAYRTVGLVASAYSTGDLNSTHYNQVSMLRTMEQILGIPPMNSMDASARLMTACFQPNKKSDSFTHLANNIPLNEMNKPLNALSGKAKRFALQSQNEVYDEVDGGEDDEMNRILWFYAKGNQPYPKKK